MAVPKYKTSKARSRCRRTINMKFTAPRLTECTNCGNSIVRHRVCPHCGFYNRKQIIAPENMG